MASSMPIPGARLRSLSRTSLRTRGAQVTTAGWRMELDADEGPGALILAEGPAGNWLRGEGVCLGLPQETLTALWSALRPGGEDEPEAQQWG